MLRIVWKRSSFHGIRYISIQHPHPWNIYKKKIIRHQINVEWKIFIWKFLPRAHWHVKAFCSFILHHKALNWDEHEELEEGYHTVPFLLSHHHWLSSYHHHKNSPRIIFVWFYNWLSKYEFFLNLNCSKKKNWSTKYLYKTYVWGNKIRRKALQFRENKMLDMHSLS